MVFQQKSLKEDVNTSTQMLYKIYAKVWDEKKLICLRIGRRATLFGPQEGRLGKP